MYDAVIIGAGISGLVCGCTLAKTGLRVLVVEKHDKPGGYFTSFMRKGFYFDAAAHSFGNYRVGGHVRKIFEDLGVDKLVRITRYDPSDIIIAPDFELVFHADLEVTLNQIGRLFPEERQNAENFFRFLRSSDKSEFSKLKGKTFDVLLRTFMKNEKLMSAFALPVFGNGGLPPSLMHGFSGAKIFSEFVLDGGYYPEGGIQSLPNAMAHIIQAHQGRIMLKRLVKRICIEQGVVVGVELDNHEMVRAAHVVSACDMVQTYKQLLADTDRGDIEVERLDELEPSVSTFILYIGIDQPFDGLPAPGVNIWYLPHYDLERMYANLQRCEFDQAGMFMLRASPDGKTILAFVGAPFKSVEFWKQHKKNIAREFLERVQRLIPKLADHVAYFDAASPATLYRYTNNFRGAAFGWAKKQTQAFDPLFVRTSPIRGLYLTGHWTSIAFGMPGACYAGHDTAKRILRKVAGPLAKKD
jgi:phytoene dehydrogenase-like protein